MAKAKFSPEVTWVPTERVVPYVHNNKKHPPEQIDKIAGAIAEYGFDVPIVVDEDNVILKGHGRLLAARQLGLKQVPVIIRTDLSPAQKKACRISDNKVAESEYDYAALKLEMESLAEMNFDLTLTGFTLEECKSQFNLGTIDFQGGQIFGEEPPKAEDDQPDTSHALEGNITPDDEPELDQPSQPLDQSDGSLLELVSVTIAEPKHQVQSGEVWRVGNHVLVVAEVLTEWQKWQKFLEGDVIFAPYPGPFVPLSIRAESTRLVMVQPDTYIAGHLLDQYELVKGVGSVSRA